MLHTIDKVSGYKLAATDGEIGKVQDFYFDDTHWTIRYLVADTGNWLTGRRVLLSPYALVDVNEEEETIGVDLTKQQIEESPSLEEGQPLSRKYEESYYGYYGWPMYWTGVYPWGSSPMLVRDPAQWKDPAHPSKESWDPNLRSTDEITGYDIQASDGEIGHVEDFVIDDTTWTIRYMIVDTKNWLPGKKVLISPQWINKVSWDESKVYVNMPRATVENAPEYDEDTLITRDYEEELYQHYDMDGYWVEGQADTKHPRYR
ncbi:MAG TPA: PRC-barrel domain-containing protein [Bacteroidota bacterium]|nr:PRC-barrel domain-containing protein [Bacteroidota bacterium]